MKTLFTILALLICATTTAQQYFTFGPSSTNNRSEFYFQNSPTNTDGNRLPVMWIKGQQSAPGVSMWSLFHIGVDTVRFGKMTGSGVAVIGLDATGRAYRLNKFTLIDSNFWATRSWVHSQITAGIDLSAYLKKTSFIWDSLPGKPLTFTPSGHTHVIMDVINLQDSLNTRLKIEVDPTVPTYSKSLTGFTSIKTSTDLLYEPLFAKNTAFNRPFGTTLGTVAEGNDARINNGQTAFGWGNHATAGYAKISDTIGGSGTGVIMTTTSANNSLNGKVSKTQTLSINGVTQNFSGNLTFTNIGVELPSQTGQSGRVLGTNGTSPQWIPLPSTTFSVSAPVAIAAGSRVMGTNTTAGTAYQVSANQDASVTLSASCQVSITVLATGTGVVFVETSANGTTGWTYRGDITRNSANTVGLTTVNGGSLTFVLPKGHYYRIQTTTTVGGLLPLSAVSYVMNGGSVVPLN